METESLFRRFFLSCAGAEDLQVPRGVDKTMETITARLACDIYKVYTDYTVSLKGEGSRGGVSLDGCRRRLMDNEFNDKIEK